MSVDIDIDTDKKINDFLLSKTKENLDDLLKKQYKDEYTENNKISAFNKFKNVHFGWASKIKNKKGTQSIITRTPRVMTILNNFFEILTYKKDNQSIQYENVQDMVRTYLVKFIEKNTLHTNIQKFFKFVVLGHLEDSEEDIFGKKIVEELIEESEEEEDEIVEDDSYLVEEDEEDEESISDDEEIYSDDEESEKTRKTKQNERKFKMRTKRDKEINIKNFEILKKKREEAKEEGDWNDENEEQYQDDVNEIGENSADLYPLKNSNVSEKYIKFILKNPKQFNDSINQLFGDIAAPIDENDPGSKRYKNIHHLLAQILKIDISKVIGINWRVGYNYRGKIFRRHDIQTKSKKPKMTITPTIIAELILFDFSNKFSTAYNNVETFENIDIPNINDTTPNFFATILEKYIIIRNDFQFKEKLEELEDKLSKKIDVFEDVIDEDEEIIDYDEDQGPEDEDAKKEREANNEEIEKKNEENERKRDLLEQKQKKEEQKKYIGLSVEFELFEELYENGLSAFFVSTVYVLELLMDDFKKVDDMPIRTPGVTTPQSTIQEIQQISQDTHIEFDKKTAWWDELQDKPGYFRWVLMVRVPKNEQKGEFLKWASKNIKFTTNHTELSIDQFIKDVQRYNADKKNRERNYVAIPENSESSWVDILFGNKLISELRNMYLKLTEQFPWLPVYLALKIQIDVIRIFIGGHLAKNYTNLKSRADVIKLVNEFNETQNNSHVSDVMVGDKLFPLRLGLLNSLEGGYERFYNLLISHKIDDEFVYDGYDNSTLVLGGPRKSIIDVMVQMGIFDNVSNIRRDYEETYKIAIDDFYNVKTTISIPSTQPNPLDSVPIVTTSVDAQSSFDDNEPSIIEAKNMNDTDYILWIREWLTDNNTVLQKILNGTKEYNKGHKNFWNEFIRNSRYAAQDGILIDQADYSSDTLVDIAIRDFNRNHQIQREKRREEKRNTALLKKMREDRSLRGSGTNLLYLPNDLSTIPTRSKRGIKSKEMSERSHISSGEKIYWMIQREFATVEFDRRGDLVKFILASDGQLFYNFMIWMAFKMGIHRIRKNTFVRLRNMFLNDEEWQENGSKLVLPDDVIRDREQIRQYSRSLWDKVGRLEVDYNDEISQPSFTIVKRQTKKRDKNSTQKTTFGISKRRRRARPRGIRRGPVKRRNPKKRLYTLQDFIAEVDHVHGMYEKDTAEKEIQSLLLNYLKYGLDYVDKYDLFKDINRKVLDDQKSITPQEAKWYRNIQNFERGWTKPPPEGNEFYKNMLVWVWTPPKTRSNTSSEWKWKSAYIINVEITPSNKEKEFGPFLYDIVYNGSKHIEYGVIKGRLEISGERGKKNMERYKLKNVRLEWYTKFSNKEKYREYNQVLYGNSRASHTKDKFISFMDDFEPGWKVGFNKSFQYKKNEDIMIWSVPQKIWYPAKLKKKYADSNVFLVSYYKKLNTIWGEDNPLESELTEVVTRGRIRLKTNYETNLSVIEEMRQDDDDVETDNSDSDEDDEQNDLPFLTPNTAVLNNKTSPLEKETIIIEPIQEFNIVDEDLKNHEIIDLTVVVDDTRTVITIPDNDITTNNKKEAYQVKTWKTWDAMLKEFKLIYVSEKDGNESDVVARNGNCLFTSIQRYINRIFELFGAEERVTVNQMIALVGYQLYNTMDEVIGETTGLNKNRKKATEEQESYEIVKETRDEKGEIITRFTNYINTDPHNNNLYRLDYYIAAMVNNNRKGRHKVWGDETVVHAFSRIIPASIVGLVKNKHVGNFVIYYTPKNNTKNVEEDIPVIYIKQTNQNHFETLTNTDEDEVRKQWSRGVGGFQKIKEDLMGKIHESQEWVDSERYSNLLEKYSSFIRNLRNSVAIKNRAKTKIEFKERYNGHYGLQPFNIGNVPSEIIASKISPNIENTSLEDDDLTSEMIGAALINLTRGAFNLIKGIKIKDLWKIAQSTRQRVSNFAKLMTKHAPKVLNKLKLIAEKGKALGLSRENISRITQIAFQRGESGLKTIAQSEAFKTVRGDILNAVNTGYPAARELLIQRARQRFEIEKSKNLENYRETLHQKNMTQRELRGLPVSTVETSTTQRLTSSNTTAFSPSDYQRFLQFQKFQQQQQFVPPINSTKQNSEKRFESIKSERRRKMEEELKSLN